MSQKETETSEGLKESLRRANRRIKIAVKKLKKLSKEMKRPEGKLYGITRELPDPTLTIRFVATQIKDEELEDIATYILRNNLLLNTIAGTWHLTGTVKSLIEEVIEDIKQAINIIEEQELRRAVDNVIDRLEAVRGLITKLEEKHEDTIYMLNVVSATMENEDNERIRRLAKHLKLAKTALELLYTGKKADAVNTIANNIETVADTRRAEWRL